MKTIVVAIDFSKGSNNALSHAVKMAKQLQVKITLVHSYSPPILDPNIPIGMIEEAYQDTIKSLEDRLRSETERIHNEGLVTNYKLSFSDISSVLNDVCSSEDVAFIVVGKTGHTSFLDRILGSTANNLIDNIHVPLLVIPENFESEIFNKLAYASQLEYDEEKYIEEAVKLAKYSKHRLYLAHIDEINELNINADENFLESISRNFENDKIQILNRKSKGFKTGIAQLITEEHITLLILTTHKRGILDGLLNPSKTKQIIKQTEIPVLIYSFD